MAQRLCFGERVRIEVMARAGFGVGEIALELAGTRRRWVVSWPAAAGCAAIWRRRRSGDVM